MNARKAKRLRREAYGDQSLRAEREYQQRVYKIAPVSRRDISDPDITGEVRTIRNKPGTPRAVYQALKKGGAACSL